MEEPNRDNPNSEKEAPKRSMLRSDIDAPRWKKSSTDMLAPRRATLRSATDEPS
jgi:hypothetical protein